ncbi:hypothetical protein B0H21DRAFT_152448 [Amylocystis lapponica]|nr:hypothetical protein B0H21DRAFT_152448 [Amylocystis lapponica]
MAPLIDEQQADPCRFNTIPVEVGLMIVKNLPLKDKLALADTCRACTVFVSEEECLLACQQAGLSRVEGASARAMAKLLHRPRKGVCNWSHEGGIPKENLDFSQVHSVGDAILKDIKVAQHPAFGPARSLYLRDTNSFDQVTLRVAPEEPDILLCKNRLYMHEYATSPPLKELLILIKEDEGSLREGQVAFRICNTTGVTLGNYWEGLYKFLHQVPDRKMNLTNDILREWYTSTILWLNFPRDPFASPSSTASATQTPVTTQTSSSTQVQKYFDRDCPTNLAMLDIYCGQLAEDIPFSDKGLSCDLPLRRGLLNLQFLQRTHSHPATPTSSRRLSVTYIGASRARRSSGTASRTRSRSSRTTVSGGKRRRLLSSEHTRLPKQQIETLYISKLHGRVISQGGLRNRDVD